MHIALDPQDPRPLYVQIVDEVRRAVLVGVLMPDEPLPSVRQLATDLRLNPNTISQAYRELERLGVVHVRRGQGTFVSEVAAGRQERKVMAREVAARALRDAQRHGVELDELVAALRSEAVAHRRRAS